MQGKVPGIALRRSIEQVVKIGDQYKYPEIFDKNGNVRGGAETVMYGDAVDGLGMSFDSRVRTIHRGGSVAYENGNVIVENADEVVFILSTGTSYNGFDKSPAFEGKDPTQQVLTTFESLKDKEFSDLIDGHVSDYQQLFNRVQISLGKLSRQSQLTTDERVRLFSNGKDPSLVALYFQFGRYLMIAGSRPGGQPLNLQGIWNDKVIPPGQAHIP